MLIHVQIQNDSIIHFGKGNIFHHKFHVRLNVTEDNQKTEVAACLSL